MVNTAPHLNAAQRVVTHLCRLMPVVLLGWVAPSDTSTATLSDTLVPISDGPVYTISKIPDGQVACVINSAGDIAGKTSYSPGANNRPIVWNQSAPASARVATMSEDEFSSVGGINDNGDVAGGFNTDVAIVPFVWTPSGGVQRIALPSGIIADEASGINKTGDVVGYSCADRGIFGFLWSEGKDAQDLKPLPGDAYSCARKINDSGQIVGVSWNGSQRHAVLWTKGGTVRELGTLPGDTSSEATGISIAGEVVGQSEGPQGTRAFRWSDTKGMQDLGTLPNGSDSQAFAINDSGVIVGTCTTSGKSRAVVWTEQGGMQDLNNAISTDLAVAFVGAHAINNNGQILATATGRQSPCADDAGACPIDDCAPAPKYFFLLTPMMPP